MLYSLAVKQGLRILILSEISEPHFEHSKSISAPLTSVIFMQGSQILDKKIINEIKYSKKKESDVLPKEKCLQYGFSLNKTEFRDTILLRYG